MICPRGLVVCVGSQYSRLLEITLPRNLRRMAECLVVTALDDESTKTVVGAVPGVTVFATDAFTRYGAIFNKGLAVEEAFDHLGRHGWLLIWDADILMPESMSLANLDHDTLYGARRRSLPDPSQWSPDLDWRRCQQIRDGGPIGYFQLFHAEASAIRDKRPWYEPTFTHAAGGDAFFMGLFPASKRRVLPIDVLHLGERHTNWFGTDQQARDRMDAYVTRNKWLRARPNIDRSAVERVGEIQERIEVPGYAPTGYDLPFARRAKQSRQG